jgi:hypothetical protein
MAPLVVGSALTSTCATEVTDGSMALQFGAGSFFGGSPVSGAAGTDAILAPIAAAWHETTFLSKTVCWQHISGRGAPDEGWPPPDSAAIAATSRNLLKPAPSCSEGAVRSRRRSCAAAGSATRPHLWVTLRGSRGDHGLERRRRRGRLGHRTLRRRRRALHSAS